MPGGSFERRVTTVSLSRVGEWVSGRMGELRPVAHSATHPLANLRSAICIKKPATNLGSGFVEIVLRSRSFSLSAQETGSTARHRCGGDASSKRGRERCSETL